MTAVRTADAPTRRHPMLSRAPRAAAPVLFMTALFCAVTPTSLTAQSTGRITGRIIDAQSGNGLSDAGIQIVGTALGAMSGIDGRYSIAAIPTGTVTIQVRRIGYVPKTVTGIMLSPNGTVEQHISLETATVQLQTQVVTASAERGTVSAALDQQRSASGIVSAVTAEQIGKSPDGDAAQAVQRVSGVTVQDGKYVVVRGLGERYTTASLNGARIPSPEPEKRIVPLDLFPAGLLQSVVTTKTFTPDQPGDFAGASVDIRTREFPAERQLTYSASIGANTSGVGNDVYAAPRSGTEWLGFAGSDRNLPGALRRAGNFESATQGDFNVVVGALRNVWSPEYRTGSPNTSMSMSLGGSDPLLGVRLGYVGALTYSYSQEVRSDEERSLADAIGSDRQTAYNRLTASTGRTSVLWGGMLNLSALVGHSSRIALNSTYTRSADDEARLEEGEEDELAIRRSTLRFVERSVRSTQLLGEHQFGSRNFVDWSVAASGVVRNEPDRVQISYVRDLAGDASAPFLFKTSTDGAQRLFAELDETSWTGALNHRLEWGALDRPTRAKVGVSHRRTGRTASNRQYYINAPRLAPADRALTPEEIFDGRFSEPGDTVFRVEPSNRAGSYVAAENLAAGFAMIDFAPLGRVRVITGARVERNDMNVETSLAGGTVVPAALATTDILPSFVVNVRATETQSIRVSATRTLSRPEYRELSAINNYEPITGIQFQGNPDLERTLISNLDLKWEWYPAASELLSVGVFGKRFTSPVERVDVAVSGVRGGQQQTVVNAEGADNVGLEAEMRMGLGRFSTFLLPVSAFANVTLMRSSIRTGNATFSASTNDDRAMTGQAPYVVNTGVSYVTESGSASATLLYNVVGRRISAAGSMPLPDVYEESRHVLDFSARMPVRAGLSAKLDVKNLLDAPYQLTQGSVTREQYRAGRVFAVGLSWRR